MFNWAHAGCPSPVVPLCLLESLLFSEWFPVSKSPASSCSSNKCRPSQRACVSMTFPATASARNWKRSLECMQPHNQYQARKGKSMSVWSIILEFRQGLVRNMVREITLLFVVSATRACGSVECRTSHRVQSSRVV